MMKWQSGEHRDVSGCYSEQINAVVSKSVREYLIKGLGKRKLTDTRFDCDLPQTRDTEKLFVGLVFNQRAGSSADQRATDEEPQERMRIEQESHHMYSSKSSNGSLKSSDIVMSPSPLPNCGRGLDFETGTSLTLWRLSFVMTICSPLTAASIKSGKWFLASSMVT